MASIDLHTLVVGATGVVGQHMMRHLAARGFRILIVITGAPRWAEGAHRPSAAPPGTWEPNAQAFGRFARAIDPPPRVARTYP